MGEKNHKNMGLVDIAVEETYEATKDIKLPKEYTNKKRGKY